MTQQIPFDCPHCGMKHAGFEFRSFYVAFPIAEKMCAKNKVQVNALLSCPNIKCCGPVVARLEFKAQAEVMTTWSQTDVRDFVVKAGNARFDFDYWFVAAAWPKPRSPNVPGNLAEPVLRIFREAELNMSNGAYESAAAMYGKALDIATVQIAVSEDERVKLKSLNLHHRIEKLGSTSRISSDLANWAKELKWARNDSSHDEAAVSSEDAEAIGEATRLILIYLFEMPARAAELKAKYNPHATKSVKP